MNPISEASGSTPDILGAAMLDFIHKRPYENIETRTSVAGLDELPVPYWAGM